MTLTHANFDMSIVNSKATLSNEIGKAAPISVIVCDDHILIRTGIRQILEEKNINVVGDCNSVDKLLDLVSEYPDAIIITDLAVDDVPFPQMIKQIKEKALFSRVVIYSMREAPSTVDLCYQSGALAFITKRSSPEEIINAIEKAQSGERYYPQNIASILANLHVDKNSPSNLLSSKEMAIFIGFASNGSVEEIAEKLDVSDKTIRNTLSIICKKLDIQRSNIRQIAKRYGLIDEFV